MQEVNVYQHEEGQKTFRTRNQVLFIKAIYDILLAHMVTCLKRIKQYMNYILCFTHMLLKIRQNKTYDYKMYDFLFQKKMKRKKNK